MEHHIASYLSHIRTEKELREKTIDVYKRDLEEFSQFIGDTPIEKLSRSHIRDFLSFLSEKNNKAITKKRKVTSLRNFFTYLIDEKIIRQSPVQNVSSPRVMEKEPRYLKENELRRLLRIAQTHECRYKRRNELMIHILIETGMRLSELVNLNASDVHDENLTVLVRRKGGREQTIPINSKLASKLEDFKKTHESNNALFESSFSRRITQRRVGLIIKKYMELSGIADATTHSLRHSFCSRLLDKGVDIKAIQILAGHRSITTTEKYLHVANEKLRKGVRAAIID